MDGAGAGVGVKPPSPRLAFAPIEEYIQVRFGNRVIPTVCNGGEWTLQSPQDMLALTIGTGRSTIYKWRREGVTVDTADRIAIALGLHPSTLWPDWYRIPVTCDA